MYHNFGNKRAVFKLALNKFIKTFGGWFESEISKAKDPIVFIKEFFRNIPKQGVEAHKKGCFLGNIVAELACTDRVGKGSCRASGKNRTNILQVY